MSYLTRIVRRPAGQLEQLHPDQVANSEGGYVFPVDPWTRLREVSGR